MKNTLGIAFLFAAIAIGGCKAKETEDDVTTTPEPAEMPVAADEAPKAVDPGAGSDTMVVTVTGFEIDPKLAQACQMAPDRVFFDFDSANLTDEANQKLKEVVDCVNSPELKDQKLVLVGRADPVGSEEYNQKLGKSRAESVHEFLVAQGLDGSRLETESRGEGGAVAEDGQRVPDERRVTIMLRD